MTAIPDTDSPGASGDEAVKRPLRDGIDTVKTSAHDVAEATREKAAKVLDTAKGGLEQARETLGDAYASSRERAADAYATAREKAKAAGKTAADGLETNPIAALLGGLALGVVAGALLPRTEREARALGSTGAKLNDLAREAAGAARDAGKAKLAELGLSPEKARESIHSLIDGAISAATTASSAAVETARTRSGKTSGAPADNSGTDTPTP
jgi:ElaB/YqjD/DUF883 family membrane-anchored ribosome-binding protein